MINFLYDFLPILLFFIAFKKFDIYIATLIGILTICVQVAVRLIIRRHVETKQYITLFVFIIFGGMTLYFHNPIFVKWKPSVIFWLFGFILLLSQFIGSKTLIQRMLENMLETKTIIPNKIWRRLNLAWTLFFLLLGAINLIVAYHFTTNTWVNFKFYGILAALFIFSFAQALYLSRYITEKNESI